MEENLPSFGLLPPDGGATGETDTFGERLLQQVVEKPGAWTEGEDLEVAGAPEIGMRVWIAVKGLEGLEDEVAGVEAAGGADLEEAGGGHGLEVRTQRSAALEMFEAMKDGFKRRELNKDFIFGFE